jgi:SPOR domain
MRQRSLAEQPPESSTSLHPVLRAALNSLDVDLEEELARYRRLQGNTRESNRSGRNPFVSQGPHAPAAVALATGDAALPENDPPPVSMPASYRPLPSPGDLMAHGAPLSVVPEGLPSDAGDMPSDYLASSEELLRGLTDEEAALSGDPEPRLLDTLLTPLGIGSMLLLLLSSISFGYLILNPQSMRLLGLEPWFNPTGSSDSGAIAQSSDATRPMAAPSPNLAAEEFPELNLDTLSALPPGSPTPASEDTSPVPTVQTSPITTPSTTASPAVAPTTAQAESAASRPVAPAAPRVQSSPRVAAAPSAAPRPAAPSVAAPQPAASAPAVAAAPAAAPLYYVVVPYSGDRSLEQVRQVVGDAYVRNSPNGARVQAGAFSEASRARALVQELSQQGISAQLIQPSN